MMKYQAKFFLSLAFLLTITPGCGSITKMRYSNGFKSNIELNFRNKTRMAVDLKACRAKKKQNNEISAFSVETTASTTENRNHPITEIDYTTNIRKLSVKITPSFKVKTKTAANDNRSIEPITHWASLLFYYGLFFLFVCSFLELPFFFAFISVLLILLGFILAIKEKKRIKTSNYFYRGNGLATSIIFLGILLVVVVALFSFIILWVA